MKSAVRFVLLALVLLIVAMLSALTAMRFAIHGQEVTVPARCCWPTNEGLEVPIT